MSRSRHRVGAPARARPAAVLAALAASLLAACGDAPAPSSAPVTAEEPAAPAPQRGLWVLCEGSQRVLEHPEKIRRLLDDAIALGATDLFVQVYRGGRAWFDSSHADATPHRQLRETHGRDTLRELVAAAHGEGLRVHAWVNALHLARNAEAPILATLGRDAVIVDQRGRNLLDYPGYDVPPPDRSHTRLGTPGIWLDPGAPGVAAHLAETFGELSARYPELDGLHLDYIRYPDVLPFVPGSRFGVGLDLGHGEPTRARFRAETGVEAPRPPQQLGNASRWDAWRREQVSALVRQIADAGRSARPGLLVSAAVWTYADRGYLAIGQDWRGWLDTGLLDLAVPMAYTLDTQLLGYLVEAFAGTPRGPRTWIGLGSWLFARRPEGALEQLRTVRAAGAAGDALFSWDSIADTPALRDALVRDRAELTGGG